MASPGTAELAGARDPRPHGLPRRPAGL